jgi:AraC family transcriptional regulator, regulatory protein of adaptative response / methylated-DNA-[protein]-cysteine methyltransferase
MMMTETLLTAPAPVRLEDERWQSVLDRDSGQDGAFVFAVRSTGIYCRPSCPARRPRRAQVRFFAHPDEAEAAGFRACRRCHPRSPANDPRPAWVGRICRLIEQHLDDAETPTLDRLSAAAGVGPHHLQRTFKRLLGLSPREWADARRLERLKAHLKSGRGVTDAGFEAGYGSMGRLYERASGPLGMPPGTYRRGGAGVSLRYTLVDSPLGRLLVAATGRGVSAVYLGDADGPLEAALQDEYPSAERRRDDRGLVSEVQAILAHLEGRLPRLDLPMDVQATAFQWKVWQALRAIPRGETRSYGEIATALGQPTGARAVARACATNPVALVVPCHRVVGGDGRLTGYRWGVEKKRALLLREKAKTARG